MGYTRDLRRSGVLASGLIMMVGGIVLMVPLGTRLVGPDCSSEFCLPIGIVQRTGVFGHPIDAVSLTVGVLAVLLGAVLVTRIVRQRRGALD